MSVRADTIIKDLERKGYELREVWGNHEVLHFVRRELGQARLPLNFLLTLLFALVVYVGFGFVRVVLQDGPWLTGLFIPFVLGVVTMLVVIVPHELLHGIAYKLRGAPTVKYGAELKQLVFYASAPFHVIGKGSMYFVALAPFVVITTALVIALIQTTGFWWWFWFGLLFMHTQGCVGDFAIINFFHRQPKTSTWLTFDDSESKSFTLLEYDETAEEE